MIRKKVFVLLAFCLFFLQGIVSAQEYTITESELTQLETNLLKQKSIIEMLKKELSLLKESENTSKQELETVLIELMQMKEELTQLQEELMKSKNSLMTANQLLKKSEKEKTKNSIGVSLLAGKESGYLGVSFEHKSLDFAFYKSIGKSNDNFLIGVKKIIVKW